MGTSVSAAGLTVRDIMTRDVVTIGMDESLAAARQVFEQHGFHHLVVLETGRPVGVISDRDLLRNLSPFVGRPLAEREQDTATLRKRIHQIMSRQLVCIQCEAPAVDCIRLMLEHKVSCVPVIRDRGRLAGIVTMRDVLRWAASVLDSASGPQASMASNVAKSSCVSESVSSRT